MEENERISVAFELANKTRHIVNAINFLGDYEDEFILIKFIYSNRNNNSYINEKYIDNINVYSKKDDCLVYQTDFDGKYCVNLYNNNSNLYSWEKHLMNIYKKKLGIINKKEKKKNKVIDDLKKYQEKKLKLKFNNYNTK